MHVAPVGLGLQRVLIGSDELAQTLHHQREDVGGDETIAQTSSRRWAHTLFIFSPPHIGLSIRNVVWKRW